MANLLPSSAELSLLLFNVSHGSVSVDDLVAGIEAVLRPVTMTADQQVARIKDVVMTAEIPVDDQVARIEAVLRPVTMTADQVAGIKAVLRIRDLTAEDQIAKIKVVLRAVTAGQVERIKAVLDSGLSTVGITDDQVAGIEAVLDSETVKNTPHLFVLSSEQGKTGAKLDTLKDSLGIEDEFRCSETVGIFQSSIEDDNFYTTFLVDNNDKAAFAKVTVPLYGGNVIVLLVSYHGLHKLPTDKKKEALRQLIKDSNKKKQENGCQAVIIGGDFNLPLSEAKEATTYFHFSAPEAKLVSFIDYVVFWSDADVKLEVTEGFPKVLRWTDEPPGKIPEAYPHVVLLPRPDPRNCPNMEPFDHPRLLYKFKVSRLMMNQVEELPGLLEGVKLNN